jgi:predicted nicotinamide N-methyase
MEELPFAEPYWGFLWPGSYSLARMCYDRPELVQNKTVLDFACGCGAAGIAALQNGSGTVVANDIDDIAVRQMPTRRHTDTPSRQRNTAQSTAHSP